MCNIAGYIGNKQAAPLLIEMMREQEGFMGGYYSGITTISNGRLYHAKVVGDVEKLVQETEALQLPGSIGLIHSRTKSGGGQAWSHPFVSDGGHLAYVANGSFGLFGTEENKNKAGEVAQDLVGKGYTFETKLPGLENYVPLGDGNYTHMSEVKCHLIASLHKEGAPLDQAMAEAFEMTPSEIVGLLIHTEIPNRIIVSRINMPMMVGRGEEETYLATTAMAFPSHIEDQFIFPLPPASTTEVFADELRISKYRPNGEKIADIPAKLWSDLHIGLEQYLLESKEDPKSIAQMVEQAKLRLPKEKILQAHLMVYEILRSFKNEHRLIITHHTVQGVQEGITAPLFKMNVKS